MDEQLYYVPKLDDIRIGYKCQWSLGMESAEDGQLHEVWTDLEISATTDLGAIAGAILNGGVRTSYLSTRQITAAGWEIEGEIVPEEAVANDKKTCLVKYTKGKYILIYDFITHVVMIAILLGDIFSVCVQRYDCPSINELTYIYSRLNLH